MSCAKTAESTEMPFGIWTGVGLTKVTCIRWGAHWRHLANTIEPSMCGGNGACSQITLTTCYLLGSIVVLCRCGLLLQTEKRGLLSVGRSVCHDRELCNKKAVLLQGRALPCDAGLYRKLAPNPQATQWIETTLKLSANMGSCQKELYNYKCIFLLPV